MFELFDSINTHTLGNIGLLERSFIYEGRSIFAPLLINNEPIIIDYITKSATERKGFQTAWLDKLDFTLPVATASIVDDGSVCSSSGLNIDINSLIIPNVLHHCRDFSSVLELIDGLNPNLEKIFIFDSYIREQHQYPDDFCRYTVPALDDTLSKFGFDRTEVSEYGNIFDGMLYLIEQARVILNNNSELFEIKNKLNEVAPLLESVSDLEEYRSLGRPYASYSSAYSVVFERRS